MSIKNDLGLAYHMGYEDALAKRKPDASQTQILASDDLADENANLRELVSDMGKMLTLASWTSVESDEQSSQCIYRAEALGIEVDL